MLSRSGRQLEIQAIEGYLHYPDPPEEKRSI